MSHSSANNAIGQMTAIVLAGGLGTRLREVVSDRPKVLAQVAGRPFLAYLLDRLAAAGVRHTVISTGYMAAMVADSFGTRHGEMAIEYSVESEPLGTGGALREAARLARPGAVLAMNGDSFAAVDLAAMLSQHRTRAATGTLAVASAPDASRYGLVEFDPESGAITRFGEKERGPGAGAGYINAGVYVLERDILAAIPREGAASLERDIFAKLSGAGLYAFTGVSAFLDIGTPEAYAEAAAFLAQEAV